MKKFSFDLSTKIYFGTGITEDAICKEQSVIKGNVLIVTTGESIVRLGFVSQLIKVLESLPSVSSIELCNKKISSNPKVHEIQSVVEDNTKKYIDVVIGFGGGSALDAAKAIAAGLGTGCDVEEFLLTGKEPDARALPIVAIPTTAGTGSELSKGAIVSSIEHHLKGGIRGEHILPKIAIVDSIYTRSIPEKITMETGFDVLAHAIESYVANNSNLMSETLSEKAIRLAANNLIRLKQDLNDYEARENMCFASMIMGINLAKVGTCFPHRMQYAIGAETDTSHAAGLVALYPAWIRAEYEVNPEKVTNVFEWMGYKKIDSNEDAKITMENFLKHLGISYSLKMLGIKEEQIEELTKAVTGNLANDKLAEIDGTVQKIFRESM